MLKNPEASERTDRHGARPNRDFYIARSAVPWRDRSLAVTTAPANGSGLFDDDDRVPGRGANAPRPPPRHDPQGSTYPSREYLTTWHAVCSPGTPVIRYLAYYARPIGLFAPHLLRRTACWVAVPPAVHD